MTTHITITVHDHLDPACEKFKGVQAPRGFRWLFRCSECRAAAIVSEPSTPEQPEGEN